MRKAFPLDLALEIIEEKVFDNPQALACLKQLEKMHNERDTKTLGLNKIQERYDALANEMQGILELLGLREYTLPNKFRASFRTYRNVSEITSPREFMAWLKDNFEPTEVIEFLTPPTTKGDLKKLCEKWLDENAGEEIAGITTDVTFIKILTDYKGLKRVKKASAKSVRGKPTRRKKRI